jgi:hypothetical protein
MKSTLNCIVFNTTSLIKNAMFAAFIEILLASDFEYMYKVFELNLSKMIKDFKKYCYNLSIITIRLDYSFFFV